MGGTVELRRPRSSPAPRLACMYVYVSAPALSFHHYAPYALTISLNALPLPSRQTEVSDRSEALLPLPPRPQRMRASSAVSHKRLQRIAHTAGDTSGRGP
eukprot:scaffold19383_cov112-Isochrysis_galbana.AAC.1